MAWTLQYTILTMTVLLHKTALVNFPMAITVKVWFMYWLWPFWKRINFNFPGNARTIKIPVGQGVLGGNPYHLFPILKVTKVEHKTGFGSFVFFGF